MKNDRRNFLQLTGKVAAGGLLLPHLACSNTSKENSANNTETASTMMPAKLDQFGIQLYTLRDEMPKDPKGVLKSIADFGYTQIEGYEHDKMGIFWDMDHLEFKKYLDDLGLSFVSTHCEISENFETKAAQAAEIGMKYLICPWIGAQESMDDWKRIADQFNDCGDICAKHGIRFAYHNHEYTFDSLEGVMPQDYLLENVNPATTDFELDMYWVVVAGVDPIEYLKKYPNRFRLCHVKDRIKGTPTGKGETSTTLGTGDIDYAKILKVAKEQGMEYYILEQERYDNTTPLEAAKTGAEYLKNLKLV